MKRYDFSFTGRQSGAIGITYKIRDTYKSDTIGEALYMLRTDYEHITGLIAQENSKKVNTEGVSLVECDISKCYPNRARDPKTGAYTHRHIDSPTV